MFILYYYWGESNYTNLNLPKSEVSLIRHCRMILSLSNFPPKTFLWGVLMTRVDTAPYTPLSVSGSAWRAEYSPQYREVNTPNVTTISVTSRVFCREIVNMNSILNTIILLINHPKKLRQLQILLEHFLGFIFLSPNCSKVMKTSWCDKVELW